MPHRPVALATDADAQKKAWSVHAPLIPHGVAGLGALLDDRRHFDALGQRHLPEVLVLVVRQRLELRLCVDMCAGMCVDMCVDMCDGTRAAGEPACSAVGGWLARHRTTD